MRSIDLLCPPETLNDNNSQPLSDNLDSSALVEQLTTKVAEAVERTSESTKTLAETISSAITDALKSMKTESNGDNGDNPEQNKEE